MCVCVCVCLCVGVQLNSFAEHLKHCKLTVLLLLLLLLNHFSPVQLCATP